MQYTRLCASSRNAIFYGIGQSSEKIQKPFGLNAIRLKTAKIGKKRLELVYFNAIHAVIFMPMQPKAIFLRMGNRQNQKSRANGGTASISNR